MKDKQNNKLSGNPKNMILKYIQDYRFNSIFVKSFAIILVLLVFTFTVIMLAVSNKMNGIITREVGSMSVNSLGKTRDRVDVVMEEAVQISGQLSLDDDIKKFLLPDTKELFGRDQTAKVKAKIEMYSGVFNYIDTIYVYSNKSRYIVSNEGGGKLSEFDDITWLDNLTEREYEPARMISRVKRNSYPYLISYIQPLRLTQMQFLGGIIVNIDISKMKELIVSNIKDSRETLTIVDNRNNILFSSNEKHIMKKIDKVDYYKDIKFQDIDGYQIIHDGDQELLVTVASSNEFNWKYISTVPLNAYDEYNKSTRGFYFKLFLACILISIVASFIIALYCYTPVKNILNLLKHPDIYEESYSVDIGLRKDETHEIALNIVRNLYSNKQMQAEMKSYTNIIDKAQLTALQAQISPHFLYNTLENIRWRAVEICRGDNEVSQIILNLSEMLRISLESDQQLVSIEEEIKNTKLYIKILQLRYEDKLQVLWEVDEKAAGYQIVKVSLQPIIENAVYHGIKPLRKLGVITISVDKLEDKIVIRVKDNGIGMSREEVERLNRDMSEKYILQEDHIGIRNVNQRIKLLMGDEAGLKIESEENLGTTVTLILPLPKTTDNL